MALEFCGLKLEYNGNFVTMLVFGNRSDWKVSDYFDVWGSADKGASLGTITYAQIPTYCKKLSFRSVQSTDYRLITSIGSYSFFLLTPKGAVEKGSVELANNFKTECKKCFSPAGGAQWETGVAKGGWYFGSNSKQPMLCYVLADSASYRMIMPSQIATKAHYEEVTLNQTATPPNFGIVGNGSVTVENVLEHCTSSVADGTTYAEGDEVSITLTADFGYKFTESDTPTVYFDTVNGGTTRPMAISADGKTAYASTSSGVGLQNLAENGVMRITGKAYEVEVATPTAEVTAQITNCTAQSMPETITQGAEYEIAFLPAEGFVFSVAPYVQYLDGSGNTQTVTGTFTAENASLSFTIDDLGDGTTALIVAGAVEADPQKFSCAVNYELSNATCDPSPEEVENGSDFSIRLSPSDTLYSFEDFDKTYVEYTDGEGNVQKVYGFYDDFHSYRTVTINGISLQKGSEIKVHAKAYSGEASFDYSEIVHCTAQPVYEAYDADFMQTSHVQRFIADEGYFFNGTVSFELTNGSGSTFFLNATFDDDRTTASITIPAGMNQLKPKSKIVAHATAIRKEKEYQISTTFLPTDRQIYELSQERYYTLSQSQGDAISLEQIDLGQYILSLRKMFVDLPSDDVQSVILGFYNTDIVCSVFEGIKHTVACGTVFVNGLYENSLDYTNAKIEASLPFVGIKELEASKVMNRNISLFYDINVTAGECVARIVDADTQQTLYVFNGFCAYDIPYILEYSLGKSYQIPEGDLSVGNLALYHVTPSITVRENDVVENEDNFGDDTALFKTLGELNGYNEIDNVLLDGVSCTTREAEMIRSLLSSGVYLPLNI